MTEEAKNSGQPEAEVVASQRAKTRASATRWQFNVVVFLFAVLFVIMVLLSLGVGINVISSVAFFGLVIAWVMGWRQEKQLYQRFYTEELSNLEQTPGKVFSVPASPLTPRELETLKYVAQGYTNREIALKLVVSEDTIKTHVARILTKLNVSDRTRAAVVATRKGLIPAE
ncbi:MAG: response regulator transcription factor [Dehalococcoidales bacterium]|nr:response regulator transcription factor [Dehalococcoidales bacterium]